MTDAQINALAARQGLEGVLVLGTEPGGPAERAGLRPAEVTPDGRLAPGDVVVAIDGAEIVTVEDLEAALERLRPGENATLTVLRDGRRLSLEIAVEPGG